MENNIEIYENVIGLIEKSITHAIAKEDKTTTNEELVSALNLLKKYKEDINETISNLRETSEWDNFTISMYGETNAGKSTLIETLRIVLGENKKKYAQIKFKELSKGINIDPIGFELLTHNIKTNTESITSEAYNVNKLLEQQTMAEEQEEQHLDLLKEELCKKKRGLPFLQKLIHTFIKLEEEHQITRNKRLLSQMKSENKVIIQKQRSLMENIKIKLNHDCQEINRIKESFSHLAAYEDGAIIGNGRSDFTTQAQTYQFDVNNQKFSVIDVPGIEGDESKVNDAINMAVKKSHVVFYITRKPSPPNKGDDGQLGTLQKIKKHLGDQTEVWSVYNKSITNPIALQGQQLLNEGELVSLQDMDKELQEQLGEAYQGSLSLSALPAFYASTDCLLPTSSHYKNQLKFLKSIDAKDLLNKSNFSSFVRFISHDVCQNYKEKIHTANRRKIRAIIDTGVAMLEQMIGTFTEAEKNLEKQFRNSAREVDNLEDSITRRMKSCTSDKSSEIKSGVRQKIYQRIESDLNNDEFKAVMEGYITSMKDHLVETLQQSLHDELTDFEAELKEVVARFHANSEEIIELNVNRHFGDGPGSIDLEFKIDGGINTVGLLSSLGGASMLVWAVFFASNPLGWSIGAALGAVTLIFSAYKSVIGFFSSSYKMEQQRKSADKNIDIVFNKIEGAIGKRLSEATKEISCKTGELKNKLSTPHKSVRNLINSLKIVRMDIGRIAKVLD